MSDYMKLKNSAYKINKIIHKGDRYYIYEAVRVSDNLKVIIKEPIIDNKNSLSVLHLYNEFEIGKKIIHENILEYIDLIESGNKPLLVKEYNNYTRLSDYIPSKGFDLETFFKVSVQIVEGLSEIHRNNIIHQLIKPSNIFINIETHQVKISDFGRSTYNYETKCDYNSFKDSFSFISPEQTGRINRSIDYRTDFYSLGITLYNMLTGKLPFDSVDILELTHFHIAKKITAPHKINNNIPEILSAIILKLLSKNADDRYQSAEGLKFDLEYCRENISKLKLPDADTDDFKIAQKDFSGRFQISQKLYGRKSEIKILQKQFNKSCNGNTVILLIKGFSGIGKSSIVYELQKEITIKNAYFSTGKYESLKRNIAYSAISYAFRVLMRQILGEPDEKIMVWKDKLQRAVGINGKVIIDIIPELELIIGKQPSVTELGSNETQNRFNLVFQNFVSVFDQMSHPLVLFLDDMQWIDIASLNLIKIITTENPAKSLLLIGAYRDNEVDASHPVIPVFDEIKKKGTDIQYINLKPLDIDSLNNLVSDTLNSKPVETKVLSSLILQKTNGNPFFIKTFFKNLYDEYLIVYKGRGKWLWNLDDIIKKQPTVNVAILMCENIKKLPSESQELLMSASCIGNTFNINILSAVSKKKKEHVKKLLEPVLISGMVYREKEDYKFVHDNVLEAAYSIIPEAEKQYKHLEIGRLLLKDTFKGSNESIIFEITGHLNKGRKIVDDIQEKSSLLELNLKAGKKAKSMAAFSTAEHYFTTGIELLGENSWESNRNLTVKLHLKLAECLLLTGKYKQSSKIMEKSLSYAKSDLEKIEVYKLRIIQYSNEGRYEEAVRLGVKSLKTVSFEMPILSKEAAEEAFNREMEFYKEYIASKNISDLFSLPFCIDPIFNSAVSIMEQLLDCALLAVPYYFPLLTIKIVNSAVKKGITFHSVVGISAFGITLMGLKQYKEAYEFGLLARKLNQEKIKNSSLKCKTSFIFGGFLAYLNQSIKDTVPIIEKSYLSGIESGNLNYAAYACTFISRAYVSANFNLKECEKIYESKTEAIKKLQIKAMYRFANSSKAFVLSLRSSKIPLSLDNDSFNEEEFRKEFHDSSLIIAVYEFYSLQFYFLFERYSEALLILFEKDLSALALTSHFPEFIFFASMLLSANYGEATEEEKNKYKKLINEYYILIQGFENSGQSNFFCFERLIKAEIFRTENRTMNEIVIVYNQAIESAKENGLIYYEALANETAARFFREHGLNSVAKLYIKEAYNLFYEWGAIAKTKDMESRYPYLQTFDIANRTVDNFLDIRSVVKATQAISSEIIIDNILKELIKIILENAGAQKGYIVLRAGKGFKIVAGFNINNKEQFKNEKLKDTKLLPETIIRYVIRTGESVILHNACKEGGYTNDKYIRAKGSKSVLAGPVRLKNKVFGAFFLENNLSTNVFSEKRIKLLNILLSQAAISMENARLYEESVEAEKRLKIKNEEIATQNEEFEVLNEELQQTNFELTLAKDKAEESDRLKTEFFNNMSHEIRTPLNGILGFSEILNGPNLTEVNRNNYIKIIQNCGKQLLRIIDDIIEISKLGTKQVKTFKEEICLNELLTELFSIFGIKAKENKTPLYLKKALPDKESTIFTDRAKLNKILSNLIENALKFTFKGFIEFGYSLISKNNSKLIEFFVKDSGIGIPPEKQAIIFDRFSQAEKELSQKVGGLGLGLSIAQENAELIDGTITLRSKRDKGSTFFLTIPYEPVFAVNESDNLLNGIQKISELYHGDIVLIVEDEEVNHLLLEALINESFEFYNVIHAKNGQEAIDICKENTEIKLVLMDLKMPVMNGFDAIKIIKEFLPGLPIIAVSAYSSKEEINRAKLAGCDDYCIKPIEKNVLKRTISKYITN